MNPLIRKDDNCSTTPITDVSKALSKGAESLKDKVKNLGMTKNMEVKQEKEIKNLR